MWTTLVICLLLATHLHAASITSSSAPSISSSTTATTSSPQFDVDEELTKIAASCLTRREVEQVSGDLLRTIYIRGVSRHLIEEGVEIIGLTEMRAVLGFKPPGPWKHFNYRKPSADELAAASTVEEYFELKEPRSENRSLDSSFFFEKNFPPAIAFLDKRFPAIRMIFRRRFEEILQKDLEGRIDRKTVDHMMHEYTENILPRVSNATEKMFRIKECWD